VEAGGEGAEAGEADQHADLGDRQVRHSEHVLSTLDAPPGQIADRRLPIRGLEAPGEVVLRHAGDRREPAEVERLPELGVDVVASPAEVRQQVDRDGAGRGTSHGP